MLKRINTTCKVCKINENHCLAEKISGKFEYVGRETKFEKEKSIWWWIPSKEETKEIVQEKEGKRILQYFLRMFVLSIYFFQKRSLLIFGKKFLTCKISSIQMKVTQP